MARSTTSLQAVPAGNAASNPMPPIYVLIRPVDGNNSWVCDMETPPTPRLLCIRSIFCSYGHPELFRPGDNFAWIAQLGWSNQSSVRSRWNGCSIPFRNTMPRIPVQPRKTRLHAIFLHLLGFVQGYLGLFATAQAAPRHPLVHIDGERRSIF